VTDDWEIGGKVKIKKRNERDEDFDDNGNVKEDRKAFRKRMEKEQRKIDKKQQELEKARDFRR
jgi:hypothetical protein